MCSWRTDRESGEIILLTSLEGPESYLTPAIFLPFQLLTPRFKHTQFWDKPRKTHPNHLYPNPGLPQAVGWQEGEEGHHRPGVPGKWPCRRLTDSHRCGQALGPRRKYVRVWHVSPKITGMWPIMNDWEARYLHDHHCQREDHQDGELIHHESGKHVEACEEEDGHGNSFRITQPISEQIHTCFSLINLLTLKLLRRVSIEGRILVSTILLCCLFMRRAMLTPNWLEPGLSDINKADWDEAHVTMSLPHITVTGGQASYVIVFLLKATHSCNKHQMYTGTNTTVKSTGSGLKSRAYH